MSFLMLLVYLCKDFIKAGFSEMTYNTGVYVMDFKFGAETDAY